MKKLILLALLVFIGACSHAMTNDQIITEVKKCKDAGLYAHIVENNWSYPDINRVICDPL